MKLATIISKNPQTESERRDGRLIVVSEENHRAVLSPKEIPTLLHAIENWSEASKILKDTYRSLPNVKDDDLIDLPQVEFMAPLPRTYAWLDGSAFIQHIILVRKARGAELPEDLYTTPLMYQGISDTLLGPNSDITLVDETYGMDFEGEVAIVVDDVPMGTDAQDASKHIKLLLLMNDVSLRNLIPKELATGFGFFHGKPSSSFAPFAVTPDELGVAWKDDRVHLPLESWLNKQQYGSPNAGEMYFSFSQLIAHACKTRSLTAGTIIGSGTVSNQDASVGSSCLAEKRMLEKIHLGGNQYSLYETR